MRASIVFRTLAAVLIVTLTARAYLILSTDRVAAKPSVPVPTAAQLQIFQDKADKACLCVRQAGHAKHDTCWADYERSVTPFKPSRIAEACAFEANLWDFFDPDEHGVSDKSVTLQRARNACTPEEEAKLTKAAPVDQRTCG